MTVGNHCYRESNVLLATVQLLEPGTREVMRAVKSLVNDHTETKQQKSLPLAVFPVPSADKT
jgi:hypothetical protein